MVQYTFSCSVYGHRSKDEAWVILKLNFSSILTRKCEDSDYYDWTTLQKVGLGKIPHKGSTVEFPCLVYVSRLLVVQEECNMVFFIWYSYSWKEICASLVSDLLLEDDYRRRSATTAKTMNMARLHLIVPVQRMIMNGKFPVWKWH